MSGRSVGVVVVLATWGALSACAGSSERLPECKGRAVPINRSSVARTTDVPPSASSPGIAVTQDPAAGARDAE